MNFRHPYQQFVLIQLSLNQKLSQTYPAALNRAIFTLKWAFLKQSLQMKEKMEEKFKFLLILI